MENEEQDDEHLLSDVLAVIRDPLSTLTDRLKVAVRFHEEHDDPASRREAAIASLVVVINFLDEIDRVYKEQLSKPLFTLFVALDRVDQGKRSPLLEPTKQSGRPADTYFEAGFKAAAAAAMTLLMDTGLPQEEAASEVAKELNRAGYRLPGEDRAPTGDTVRRWRDDCTGYHGGTTMGQRYEETLEIVRKLKRTDRAAALRLAARAGMRERGLVSSAFLKNPEKPPY